MTLSSGSLASQGEEEHPELSRPRPTEKYWEDYEDWKTHHPSAIESFDRFRAVAQGKLLTVFLDYDGTISDIVSNPDKAYMTDEMRDAVSRVASLYPTAIISGRSREKVYDFVRLPQLYYAGSHGLDIVGPKCDDDDHVELHQPAPWAPAVMDRVYLWCKEAVSDIPGANVEHNKFCVSVHYRNCEQKWWGAVQDVVHRAVAADPKRLKKAEGRKVFEVKPRVAWDKGKALSFLLGELDLRRRYGYAEGEIMSLYFGDDHTDEDAFHELREVPKECGAGVIVSTVPKPTNARFSVRDPGEVLVFLNKLADLAESGVTKSLCTSVASGGAKSAGGRGEGVKTGEDAPGGSDSSDPVAETTNRGRRGEAA
mmetsp:Transcript_2964/g.12792  ORF Transcript_2964/g.12792 Transcript_2964/m.12792 type:complete len:368 (-) Transcript_2964:4775-5878(-)